MLFKKAVALLLCLLMSTSFLAACGAGDEHSETEALSESESITETQKQTESASEEGSESTPETDVESDSESEDVSESENVSQTESTEETESDTETEGNTETESVSETESISDTESESASESESEFESDSETKPEDDPNHQHETGWVSDENGHYQGYICGCENEGAPTYTTHKDADKNGFCDTCTYVVCTHTFAEAYTKNKTSHWHASTCGCWVTTEKQPHGDEDKNGLCDDCSYVLCTHTYAETYTQTETHHYLVNTCDCDIDPELLPHVDDTKDGICDTCLYLMCVEHTYGEGYESNRTLHWHPLTCGCEFIPDDAEAHLDEDGDHLCDTCLFFLSDFTQEGTVSTNVFPEYTKFNGAFEAEYLIPALKQKMIPQGMDVWQEKGLILVSGYFKSTSHHATSVIVAIDIETGAYVGEYDLYNMDGTAHVSHVGGIAVSENNIYLSNGQNLYRIPLSQLEDVGRKGDLHIVEKIAIPLGGSYCNYSQGYLWVGQFYIPNNASYSNTPEWCHMTNNMGGAYGTACIGYKITNETESGIAAEHWNAETEYAVPDVVFSTTQKIQGITVLDDGTVILSYSYGRNSNSRIYFYDKFFAEGAEKEAHATVELGGKMIPVYFLDGKAANTYYSAPPGSEGVASDGKKLFVLFEMGATYFHTGAEKNPTDHIWAYTIPASDEE